MTMTERQLAAEERRRAQNMRSAMADAFFGAFHRLNADHLTKMQTTPQIVSSEARQLLTVLRDETQSKSIYDRCVAIVGERGA